MDTRDFIIAFNEDFPVQAEFLRGIKQLKLHPKTTIQPLSQRKYVIRTVTARDMGAVLKLHDKHKIPDNWKIDGQVSVHPYEKDLAKPAARSHSFIIKGIHTSHATEDILSELKEDIPDAKAFRIISSANSKPTPLVRIVTSDPQACQNAIENGIALSYIHFQCEEPHNKPRILQCNKCYKFGHTAANCSDLITCLKCGDTTHTISACPSQKINCKNCGGEHLPASLLCHVKRSETHK